MAGDTNKLFTYFGSETVLWLSVEEMLQMVSNRYSSRVVVVRTQQ